MVHLNLLASFCFSDANMSGMDIFLWTAQTILLGGTSLKPLMAICKKLKKKLSTYLLIVSVEN